MPKNPTWRNKCLCIFKPQYEVKNRPDSVIIQDEEVAEIAEYLLDEIEINLKVTLEVNSAFMMQWDVPNIRDQFLLLREVLEEKIIRMDDWMSQNLADHFYGAKKNYKWSKKQ